MNSTKRERPVPTLTPAMMRLAADLLDMASSTYSNFGCNDFRLDLVPGFETQEARIAFDRALYAFNGEAMHLRAKGGTS